MSSVNPSPEFEKLPFWVQQKVLLIGIPNIEEWLKTPIPALGHCTISQVVGKAGGEALLRDYFAKVLGRF